MTKAEIRKYNKLMHMTTKGDAAKREVMQKKIEMQKAKIAAMQAKIEEAKKKLALENAKGRQMVDEYNYFVERTMNEHLIDLHDLKEKMDAEKAADDAKEQVKAANADRAEVKDIIAPKPPENDPQNAEKPAHDTEPTEAPKTQNTGVSDGHIPHELTDADIDAIFGGDNEDITENDDSFLASLGHDAPTPAKTGHIAQKNDVSASSGIKTHDGQKTAQKAPKTPGKKKSLIDTLRERAEQHKKEQNL